MGTANNFQKLFKLTPVQLGFKLILADNKVLANETKLTTLEKETPDALEMAEEAHEEGKAEKECSSPLKARKRLSLWNPPPAHPANREPRMRLEAQNSYARHAAKWRS